MTIATGSEARHSAGVLAVLTDPILRDELDRVAAAVGVRVVHAGESAVGRKTWSAAAAVVLDAAGADRCGRAALPRRAHVTVLCAAEPAPPTWAAAIAVGAQHVLSLPEQEHELIRELAESAESIRDDGSRGGAIAVIGGCGGAGASLFAAAAAGPRIMHCCLILIPGAAASICCSAGSPPPDCAGPTWHCRRWLNWPAVRDALPCLQGVSVLSGTRRGYELDAGPVDAVIDGGRRGESRWCAICPGA